MHERTIDAPEALSLGMVNRVVAKGEALAAAREIAEAFAASSPSFIRAFRQAMDPVEDIEVALAANGPILAWLLARDMKATVTAFAEKRTSRWSNS